MNYPQGVSKKETVNNASIKNKNTYSNRGKTLEEDINLTNLFYLETNMAIIHKKPTPIQIVQVDYPKRSAAVIKEAYFQTKSTTDYNGIYKGQHIDFEAKETKNKTSFPLNNIHQHQIRHLKSIIEHGGIAFFIIRFTTLDETYFLTAENLLPYWDKNLNLLKKSISYKDIKEQAVFIPFNYQLRVDYLKVIDSVCFSEGANGGK